MSILATEINERETVINELSEAANEVLDRCLKQTDVRAEINKDRFSKLAWSTVAQAGWFGVTLSEKHGGLGLGLPELVGIMAAAGRHLLPGPLIEHTGVIPLLLPRASGTGAARLLEAVAGGRTTAVVDPAATGSCVDPPRLDGGLLNGSVDLVRFADRAQDLLVVTGGKEPNGRCNAGIVMVSASGLGVSVQNQASFDPLMRYARIEFDSCPVEEIILDPGGQADGVLSKVRSTSRILAAAELAGVARYLLDQSVSYAKDRVQFGRTIGSFQAVQHLLADMTIAVHQLEAVVNDGARRGLLEVPSAAVGWRLKALSARAIREIGETAMQIHGGIAFTEEHELHRAFQHGIALQGYYGDERVLARELGRALLTGHLEPWEDD